MRERERGGRRGGSKSFFPSVRNRLLQKIPIFLVFTTVVTGHGKLRSYLHRFGLTNILTCPCEEEEEEEETRDCLIFQYKKLRIRRNETIKQIKNTGGSWPTTTETLVNNYSQIFVKFVKSMDFADLQ